MIQYAVRRLLFLIPTLFGMSLVIFLLVRLLPGDVVDAMLSGDVGANAAAKAAVRKSLGLNEPLPVQYVNFITGAFTGSLRSFTTGQPVSRVLAGAIPITLELAVMATVLAIVVGVPLGVLSAVRPNSALDFVARVGGLLGLSLPNFWFATLALLFTSVIIGWIPPVTWIPPFQNLLGNLAQMAIPAVAISVYLLATVMRMTRASMLEVLGQDFVRTARAKGAPWRRVITHHALRNAVIPVITVVGFQLGTLLSGATIVEVIFGLPGMGYTLVQAIYTRDYPVIEVVALLLAAVFVVLNLLVDLLYGVVDPRIQQS